MWHRLLGPEWSGAEKKSEAPATKRRCQARRLFLEPLEGRQLLAVVLGTSGPDIITIDDSGTDLLVTINGGAPQTVSGPIDSITINAGDGDDVINVNGVPTSGGGTGTVTEVEPNEDDFNSPPEVFQLLDNSAGWNLALNANIGDADGFDVSEVYPHVTVDGTGDGTVDIFKIEIPNNSVAVFDIDGTSAGSDTQLDLYDANGVWVTDNDDGLTFWGAGGSDPDSAPYDHDNNPITPDVEDTLDAFISHGVITGGTFYVRVSSTGGIPIPMGETYKLQVAIQDHWMASGSTPPVVVNGEGGTDTLNIDPALTPGVLHLGPAAFSGTFGDGEISYTSIEGVGSAGTYKLDVDLSALGLEDGNADTTFIRPDNGGTQLLVDVNGVPFFAGAIANIDDPAQNQDITVTGTGDSDTITISNTLLSAVVYGQAGNDSITTAGGNDYVSGGTGSDVISGGSGQDRLYGNDGADVVSGGGGNDLLSGGGGNDQLTGGAGRDVLVGGLGADTAFGNGDSDLFFASGAKDSDDFPSVDGDSQAVMDANDVAMLQLLADWGVFATNTFISTGNDGEFDRMFGGAGDDEGVGDGSFLFVEQQPN
jgi:Ca2+-binding RTX toxin-like protein